MQRYAAFLRGMNVGGHRVTNQRLCALFAEMGFEEPAAFLASGNVVFGSDTVNDADIAARLEAGLLGSLGYAVPVFLRTGDQVRAIASTEAFTPAELQRTEGRVQVALLRSEPTEAARRLVLDQATEADRLVVRGRELYWLPRAGVSTSDLDFGLIERTLDGMTVRTARTIVRLAAKHFAA